MCDRSKPRRHPLDTIPVRHPDSGALISSDSFKQITCIVDYKVGSAILPMRRFCDFSSGEMRHQLHPVANAEDRNVLVEQFFRDYRRFLLIDTRRPSGQDDALRPIR